MTPTPQQEADARALLAKGNQLGQQASQQTGVAFNPIAPQTTPPQVSANALSSPQGLYTIPPFNPPAPPNPNGPLPQFSNTPEMDRLIAEGDRTVQEAGDLTKKLGTKASRKAELETSAGIPESNKQALELMNQIRSNNVAANDATQFSEDRTAPQFAIRGEQAQIERQRSAKNYGLAAALEAVNGNIAVARDNIDRALDAEFGGIEAEIKQKELIYNNIKDKLNTEQTKAAKNFELRLAEEKRKLEEARSARSNILNLVTTLGQNQAPTDILNSVLAAKTEEEALRIAAEAGVFIDPNDLKTQVVKLDDGNTVLINTQTGETIRRLGGTAPTGATPGSVVDANGQTVEFGTPEYILARLQQTAGSKTKLTQSEREQMGKFANVIALTDNLVGALSETTNDPLIGYLKSLNPYDFDARAVNAQVIALVPSVARGIYGEVGVLTDSDMERYLKTLPNIRSTADQNKFIAMMTLANARRSYEQTLINAANSGVNVSGFADSYKSINSKLNQLEQELSVGSAGAKFNTQETAKYDFSPQPDQQAQGFLSNVSNYAKWLFGL